MITKKINFVFFGGEPLAVPVLDTLLEAGLIPSLIICNPDKPAGRNLKMTPPRTKVWAQEHNVTFIQNLEIAGDFDLFVVVAYGKIIPKEILDRAKLGTINLHPSLLPTYRGPSPIISAILNGDEKTGVTIIKLDEEMDHGPILAQEKIILGGSELATDLEKKLADLGGKLLVRVMNDFENIKPYEQDHSRATLTKKVKKEDGQVDLEKESGEALYRKFRAYTNWPRTFFFKDGKRIIIAKAKLEDGKFIIEKVIPEGGKEAIYRG